MGTDIAAKLGSAYVTAAVWQCGCTPGRPKIAHLKHGAQRAAIPHQAIALRVRSFCANHILVLWVCAVASSPVIGLYLQGEAAYTAQSLASSRWGRVVSTKTLWNWCNLLSMFGDSA